MWRVAKALLPVLGAVAAAASIVAVLPKFSIASELPLNPNDILSTPFAVTYDGYVPVSNVKFSCALERIDYADSNQMAKSMVRSSDRPRSIHPGDTQTVSCYVSLPAMPAVVTESKVVYADITIWVSYSPALLPFVHLMQSFPFRTLRQSDGALRWVRFAAGG